MRNLENRRRGYLLALMTVGVFNTAAADDLNAADFYVVPQWLRRVDRHLACPRSRRCGWSVRNTAACS